MDNQPIVPSAGCTALELKLKGFNVYKFEDTASPIPTFSRRDFYKIGIFTAKTLIQYADRGIELDGTYLMFATPHIPYSSQLLSEKQWGYACLFTEEFLKPHDRSESLQQSPLFKIGGTPIFPINEEQKAFITSVFERMLAEQATDYIFKGELIRNYINVIIHETLKMQPTSSFFIHKNASSRIASLFLELLERQFPVESVKRPLALRTAQEFADRLSVHVNHLNRAVKETTGKPTSVHIAERITSEAKALLQHTDLSIAEIAYSLGFDYPPHFNNFFKRNTGTIPKAFRPQLAGTAPTV